MRQIFDPGMFGPYADKDVHWLLRVPSAEAAATCEL